MSAKKEVIHNFKSCEPFAEIDHVRFEDTRKDAENQVKSASLITQAIEAAEAEGNDELVSDLLRVKQVEAWRRHNQRILELTELID
jgi:hypothetical protein